MQHRLSVFTFINRRTSHTTLYMYSVHCTLYTIKYSMTQAGQAGFWPKRGAWSPGPPHFPPLGDTTPCPALFRGDLA